MRNPRVGIIGAGQLGRMMALAGFPLGIDCRFLDTHSESPGGQVAPIRVAALDDIEALEALARDVDVVTFDIENVSVEALRSLETIAPVRPGPDIVALGQDRLHEKRLFERLDIPTAAYVPVESTADLGGAPKTLGWPIVLKARRLGYDGRGQRVAADPGELESAWHELGERPAIAEGHVDFDAEASLIGVRGAGGNIRFYPLTANTHRDGMLESSVAPFRDPALQARAEAWMAAMLEQHDYRGVLTIEFFVADGGLIANALAPRVHHSGHWTIEGAETSQFENHLRAILDLPLGSAAPRGFAAMRNLIGNVPPAATLLAFEGLHLHDYGKEPRPRRKVGHCTLTDSDPLALEQRLETLEALLRQAGQ
jgi:5-(carboxyamino)imidazole ribonucleotide synthase